MARSWCYPHRIKMLQTNQYLSNHRIHHPTPPPTQIPRNFNHETLKRRRNFLLRGRRKFSFSSATPENGSQFFFLTFSTLDFLLRLDLCLGWGERKNQNGADFPSSFPLISLGKTTNFTSDCDSQWGWNCHLASPHPTLEWHNIDQQIEMGRNSR